MREPNGSSEPRAPGEALFRLLVRLYPRSFWDRFGPDLIWTYRDGYADCGPRLGDRMRFVLSILRDFVTTLPRAWWSHLTRRKRRVRPVRKRERQLMQNLIKDVRYAVRGLIRKPGLGVTAVTALALGIGLTTSMFSIVNGVVLKGLPVEDPQEIMGINRINPTEGANRLATRLHDYFDLAERQTTFEGLAAMTQEPMNVSPPGGKPEFVSGATVTANTFGLLAMPPMLGRGFDIADEKVGGEPVIVVGYRFWRDRLASDAGVVGRTIRVNGRPTTIIGVMPDGFEFPFNQELWQPLRVNPLEVPRGQGQLLTMFGRLKDGVSMAQGRADLERIMMQLGEEFPETNAGMSVAVGPYTRELIGPGAPLLFVMLGAVSLVLLIACANVANLLLARASLRGKEVAVRTALGASRSRVMVQLLVEAAVIAVTGAIVGIGVAQLGIGAFNGALQALPQGLPFWFAIEIDPRVLQFVLLLTVAASLLSGVIPALRASGTDVNAVLKDDSRGASSLRIGRLSRGLVVMEVAFSCALLVVAGLMVKSVTNLSNVDYDFATESIFTAAVSLPATDYPDPESQQRFFRELNDRLSGVPGALAAAVTTDLPVVGFGNGRFAIEGKTYLADRDYPSARLGSITPEYFPTLEASLLEGRNFTEFDNAAALPVVIVNESFANQHFGGASPLGQRLSLQGTLQQGVTNARDERWYTVVGMAPDMYLEGDAFILSENAMYFPFAQRPASTVNIIVRAQGEPLDLSAGVREVVAAMDPDLPISQITTLGQSIRDTQWFFTIFGAMFTIFGGVALFLATVGLYGVLSFSVNQRQHEVGLRVALGASPGQVVRLVMRQGLLQLGVGMAIGGALAIGLGRAVALLLYEVTATDPAVFFGIVAVLVATGAFACFLPARRATRVDPMVAMRAE